MDTVVISAQIVVFGYTLILQGAYCGNLALRQQAVQATRYNSLGKAGHAVDGSLSGDWFQAACSSTAGNADHPWWRVDLGKSFLVDEVFIRNRVDCCMAELRGFEIRIGDSLENDGNSNPKCGDLYSMTAIAKKSFYCTPAMRGRYVNIRIPEASRILTLCEVIVNPNPTENIAAQKSTSESSQQHTGAPSKAVDGNSDGSYSHGSCTHTGEETKPWWRVDLGTSKLVSEVFVVNRIGNRVRLNNAEVRVGDVLNNNGNNNPQCGEIFSMIKEYKKSVYCKPRKTGRYINIRLLGAGQVLTLCEVSVYSQSKAFLRDKPVQPTPVLAYRNYPLTLTCPEAFGFPVPHVAWMYNGSVLQNSTTKSAIHLNSPVVNHNHKVECVATNRHGADFHQLQLRLFKSRFAMCTDYKDISQNTRDIQYKVTDSSAAIEDSSIDQQQWVRFVYSRSPRQLPETCVEPWSCGTQASGWLQGQHPSEEDNIVERTVCFSWNGVCCAFQTKVLVRKCYGHYVYRLNATHFHVKARYCTAPSTLKTQDVLFTASQNRGYALEGHVIHKEANVHETSTCMVYCLVERQCVSFNYYPDENTCDLNNATRLQDSQNFRRQLRSEYYERNSEQWLTVMEI